MFDRKVALIFDQMETEYDQITDLWYSWLFARLHFLIASQTIRKWTNTKRKVIDIGCGTGFQSFLYSKSGADVFGIDISQRLVDVANKKVKYFDPSLPISFFDPKFSFVGEYETRINEILSGLVKPANYSLPSFSIGDALQIPFADSSFDHANCCGSTLSFIKDYQKTILEINRVLKPSGTFVMEVEAKLNPDLFWTLLDSTLLFGLLQFDTSIKEAINLTLKGMGSHVTVEYPFGEPRNPVYMDICLFKKRKLIAELKQRGLIVDKCYSIHSVTNLIPSTILDSSSPSRLLRYSFRLLSKIEERLPFFTPGCSLVLFGHKAPK